MAAVTDLQIAPGLLTLLLGTEPALALIQAVAWLDPLSLDQSFPGDEPVFDYEEEDDLTMSFSVCRACFPEVYVSVYQSLMQGATTRAVQDYLLEGINAHLVAPVQFPEMLRYGPPLDCQGITLERIAECDDPTHPLYRAQAILTLFGIRGMDTSTMGDWERASVAASVIQRSLTCHTAPLYQDVCALLAWLFSSSGNELVDWSPDELWDSGVELPAWTLEDIAAVNALSLEAEAILASAFRGLAALEQQPPLLATLKRHLKTVFKSIKKKGKYAHAHAVCSDGERAALARRLNWPKCAGDSPSDQANPDAGDVSVRDNSTPHAG